MLFFRSFSVSCSLFSLEKSHTATRTLFSRRSSSLRCRVEPSRYHPIVSPHSLWNLGPRGGSACCWAIDHADHDPIFTRSCSMCACVCLLLCAHVSKSTRVWTFADRSKTIPAEGLNDKRGKEKSSDAKNDVCSCADGVLPGFWSLWVSFCLVVKCVASLNAVIHNATMQQHKVPNKYNAQLI